MTVGSPRQLPDSPVRENETMTEKTIVVNPPTRARHSYTQRIHAGPEAVFPLLCPVREHEWVPGWATDWVISASGVAEEGCVFQTPGEGDLPPAVWVVTEHDPGTFHVAMVKTQPGYLVTRLQIDLAPDGGDTLSTISYEYTALGPEGEDFVERCTPEWYEEFMQGWEEVMNAFLAR